MVKQTVTKEMYVTEDAREFTSEASAKQHELKLSWFSDRAKSFQVDTLRIDKEYHTVFIERADEVTRKTIGNAFSLTNPENIVDGWNLIVDNKKLSGCYPIERLITEAFQSRDQHQINPPNETAPAPQETKTLTEFKGKLQRLVTRYNTDPAIKNMSVGAILGGLLIDLDLLLINN